jgi:calcium-dependent protein kinase
MGNNGSRNVGDPVEKNDSARSELLQGRKNLTEKLDNIQVTGRYHMSPRRIEDDYILQGAQVTDALAALGKKDELGNGYNGAVTLAISRASGQKFAVKPFKIRGLNPKQLEELRTEVELFLTMDHPHIARLNDVYESDQQLKLVMECLEGGELFDRILASRTFSEHVAADTLYQMLLSINYLHSKEIVHRDIKLENYLYDTKSCEHLKLIDFGFSCIHKAKDQKMLMSCGTLSYMAPEVVSKVGYTKACDLWSVGVVLFILLLGYMPFKSPDEKQMVEAIKRGEPYKREGHWSKLSSTAKDLLGKLINKEPCLRLTAESALQHPFITFRHKNADHKTEQVDEAIVDSLCNFSKASHFRRACMSMMAWSLTNQQRAEVRKAFVEMDRDKRGVITLNELKMVLERKMEISQDEAKNIFQALDTNSNEEINYSDFLAAMCSSRIQMNDNLIRDAFKRFDKDNSGFITIDNLKEVLGDDYRGQDIEAMLKEADIRQDGRISLEEFFEYLTGDALESHQTAAVAIIEREEKRIATKRPDQDPSAQDGTPKVADQNPTQSVCCSTM